MKCLEDIYTKFVLTELKQTLHHFFIIYLSFFKNFILLSICYLSAKPTSCLFVCLAVCMFISVHTCVRMFMLEVLCMILCVYVCVCECMCLYMRICANTYLFTPESHRESLHLVEEIYWPACSTGILHYPISCAQLTYASAIWINKTRGVAIYRRLYDVHSARHFLHSNNDVYCSGM